MVKSYLNPQTVLQAKRLEYKYLGILREIVAQKNNYSTEEDFLASWLRIANLLAGVIQRILLISICGHDKHIL